MSIKSKLLLKALRFEDITDRYERKKNRNLASICEIFKEFVSCGQENYLVGKYLIIDGMLEACLEVVANFGSIS